MQLSVLYKTISRCLKHKYKFVLNLYYNKIIIKIGLMTNLYLNIYI